MTIALLSGASSGALHAVTGPDHLLSLGPVALRSPHTAGRVGLQWGAGHALGTLLLSLPLLLLVRSAHVATLAAYSDRLAGLALIATAAWSWRAAHRVQRGPGAEARSPLWVGLVHGVTGAGALVLLLPNMLGGSLPRAIAYLLSFAAGSTLIMGLLTSLIGRCGAALSAPTIARLQRVLLGAALLLGAAWLLGA
jgi:nickel/cobalt transporter (NicO) family protein